MNRQTVVGYAMALVIWLSGVSILVSLGRFNAARIVLVSIGGGLLGWLAFVVLPWWMDRTDKEAGG